MAYAHRVVVANTTSKKFHNAKFFVVQSNIFAERAKFLCRTSQVLLQHEPSFSQSWQSFSQSWQSFSQSWQSFSQSKQKDFYSTGKICAAQPKFFQCQCIS
jgi:hypothetical protein